MFHFRFPALTVRSRHVQTVQHELLRTGHLRTPEAWVEVGFLPTTGRYDIRHIVIEPLHRKRNIGRAIVETIKAEAIARNWDIAALTVDPNAVGFWRKLGFAPDPHACFKNDWIWHPPPKPPAAR